MKSYGQFLAESVPDKDHCSISAISHVTGRSEDDVWEHAKKHWKPGYGMNSGGIHHTLKALGHRYGKFRHDLTYRTDSSNHTISSLRPLLDAEPPHKKFIIGTKGHAMSYVGKELKDIASVGGGTKIGSVYEVDPS